jgi:hypothetical protein
MGNDNYSDSNETKRVMLQIFHERSNQLANMLMALNGFMIVFIGGLITFAGSSVFSSPQCVTEVNEQAITCITNNSEKFIPLLIAINIAIIVVILWRFYAHYIDDDIVKQYCKIIRIEDSLRIRDLDKKITLRSQLNESEDIPIEDIDFGSRGQWVFDLFACLFCFILLIVEYLIIINYPITKVMIQFFLFFVIIVITSFAFYCICKRKTCEKKFVGFKNILCNDKIIICILFFLIVISLLSLIWFSLSK